MTAEQAERWNIGDMKNHDLDTVKVAILEPEFRTRIVTLRRATNKKLEPETADMMDGMPANRCGDWA